MAQHLLYGDQTKLDSSPDPVDPIAMDDRRQLAGWAADLSALLAEHGPNATVASVVAAQGDAHKGRRGPAPDSCPLEHAQEDS